jgi:heme/copper-type cytochrome/quinol oxidase subunit 2
MKTNFHNKTLSVLLTLVTTLAVVNITLFPYLGNNKLIRLKKFTSAYVTKVNKAIYRFTFFYRF